jgi:hypothetical protein
VATHRGAERAQVLRYRTVVGDWIRALPGRGRRRYAADGISDARGCAAAEGAAGARPTRRRPGKPSARITIAVIRRACLFAALGIAATAAVGAGAPGRHPMTVKMIVADTDSVHTRIRDTSAAHGLPPEQLSHDSVVARRKAAAHARRVGADSIKAHSATPVDRAVP